MADNTEPKEKEKRGAIWVMNSRSHKIGLKKKFVSRFPPYNYVFPWYWAREKEGTRGLKMVTFIRSRPSCRPAASLSPASGSYWSYFRKFFRPPPMITWNGSNDLWNTVSFYESTTWIIMTYSDDNQILIIIKTHTPRYVWM